MAQVSRKGAKCIHISKGTKVELPQQLWMLFAARCFVALPTRYGHRGEGKEELPLSTFLCMTPADREQAKTRAQQAAAQYGGGLEQFLADIQAKGRRKPGVPLSLRKQRDDFLNSVRIRARQQPALGRHRMWAHIEALLESDRRKQKGGRRSQSR
jgi:hypothetical protein